MLLYIVSLIPIALYLILIKGLDDFALTQSKKIALWMGWGVLACAICFLGGRYYSGNGFALIEEIVKVLPLMISINRKKTVFFSESAMYGSAIGAGFALLENILYVIFASNLTLGDALIRGFGTALLHIGCTALLSCVTLVGIRICFGKSSILCILTSIVAFIPSMAIHLAYNLSPMPVYLRMILVIIVVLVLEYLFYRLDIKLINKWLDSCINNDISLLKAIREGNLRNTKAGQYLIDGKNKFQPEVFFDILMYLGLYLEVSIEAKSRLIMKSAGIEMPIDEKTHENNVSKIRELSNLRKMIGKSGTMYLTPLVNFKSVDQWVISELL